MSDRSEEDRQKFHRVACWIPFFYGALCHHGGLGLRDDIAAFVA